MTYPNTPATKELAARAARARAAMAGRIEPSAADELRDRLADIEDEVRGVTGAVMRAVAAADPEAQEPPRPNLYVVR